MTRFKFVQRFIDRDGHPRSYFRRPGYKRVALPGLPGSPEFMAAYQAASARRLPSLPRNKVLFKERNVRRAIRAARKEGLVVGSLEVGPDGTISVHAVPPGTRSHESELDKWLGEHPDADQAQGHQ